MKKSNIEITLRIPELLVNQIRDDLKRKHPFAFERVGFLFTRTKNLGTNRKLIIASKYIPVDDQNYIEDDTVGARINDSSIREAMQVILDNDFGCIHVHFHNEYGAPLPSPVDIHGIEPIINSFNNISGSDQMNGVMILSKDSLFISFNKVKPDLGITPTLTSIIGYPMKFFPKTIIRSRNRDAIFSRQTFLGSDSSTLFSLVKIGIIGYGGGGSHMGQQLAHIGFRNFVIFDPDKIEPSNLNRLIGAKYTDIKKVLPKTSIAKRLILDVSPSSKVKCISSTWQENAEELQACDIVIGCVDSYNQRQQLEAQCRRFLIPYIDIGMDVFKDPNDTFSIAGQIILSMPGMPCMQCFGFLTENKLAKEAAKYGDVGGNPQVVWSNGTLASSAIGIIVDLITNWTCLKERKVYLAYDGNLSLLTNHIRLDFVEKECSHYPIKNAGSVKFIKV